MTSREITITFSAGEIVSMHNDLLHPAQNAIGPRQTGAAKIVTEARRLVDEIPKNERCEEREGGGVQCDLVKGHDDGHWIKPGRYLPQRYYGPDDNTHPEEYIP